MPEVFQSDMAAAVGADNNVVSVAGQLFHGAADAPQRAAARTAAAADAGTATLSVEQAIAKAVFDLTGYAFEPSDFKSAEARRNVDTRPYRFYESPRELTPPARVPETTAAPSFSRPVRVKDVLF